MRHECNRMTNGSDWMHCSACEGRIHLDGCTAKKNKNKDCCWQRHKMLLEQGHTVGLSDSAEPMWSDLWESEMNQEKGVTK